MRLALLLLLLGACSRKDEPRQAPPQAPAQPGEGALAVVCQKAACSGPMAHVEVWTSPQGAVGRYVHHGDMSRCSHPPTTYFDGEGKPLDTIGNVPVAVNSPEHQRLRERREALLQGFKRAADRSCPAAP